MTHRLSTSQTGSRAALVMLLSLVSSAATAQSIQGTATYKERIALPSGALFEATLEDVSRADAKAETIARQQIMSPGNPPIAFTIRYDPARIVADRRYAVRARILLADKVVFTTDSAAPVLTRGSPARVSLLLRRVGAAQAQPPNAGGSSSAAGTASPLGATSWQLVRFQGGDDTTLTPDDRAKYTIEFGTDGQLAARIDCNRGRGTWKSSVPNRIEFGPLALTRAQCPPGSLHDQIARQWSNIRSFVIKDGHLFLALMADGGIYELEPFEKAKK